MGRFLVVLLVLCASVASAHERDDRTHRDGDDALRLPMVYDAQGRPVGPLEVFSGVNGVFLPIDGATVFVEVDHKRIGPSQYSASQYEWVGYTSVPYASHDCSGGVLVADAGSPTPAMPVRDGVDVTVYIAGDGYSGGVQVWSFRQTDSSGVTSCSATPIDEGDLYWAVKRTYPLTQHYPEPLRVEY